MTEFDWPNLISEMATNCPLLLDVILAAMNHELTEPINNIIPRIGMCYAIIMQTRNHELSCLVQRMNTILLAKGNARKKVIIL
jgi:hypothetical protein